MAKPSSFESDRLNRRSDCARADKIGIGPPFGQSATISLSSSQWRHHGEVTPTRRCCADITTGARLRALEHWTSSCCPWEGVAFRLLNAPPSPTSPTEPHDTLTGEGGHTCRPTLLFPLLSAWLRKTHRAPVVCFQPLLAHNSCVAPKYWELGGVRCQREVPSDIFFGYLDLPADNTTSAYFFLPSLLTATAAGDLFFFLIVITLCQNVVEISRQREIWRWLRGEYREGSRSIGGFIVAFARG